MVTQANKTTGTLSSIWWGFHFLFVSKHNLHQLSLDPHTLRNTFGVQGSPVTCVQTHRHGATHCSFRANQRRLRCTLVLNSKSPLVHSTEITKLAGSKLDLDRRAEEADLICLLTDGSPITHSHPPASHVGMERPPTVRLERACRRRRRWLLLNMKCRSLGMNTLFRLGETHRLIFFSFVVLSVPCRTDPRLSFMAIKLTINLIREVAFPQMLNSHCVRPLRHFALYRIY